MHSSVIVYIRGSVFLLLFDWIIFIFTIFIYNYITIRSARQTQS